MLVVRIAVALVAFAFGVSVIAPATAQAAAKPFDANAVRMADLLHEIVCLPHEPGASSTSTPESAGHDGDVALSQGHCQAAVADYQVVIDAHRNGPAALFRQFLAAAALVGQTGDRAMAVKNAELAYHDADLGVAAAPKDPVFLVMRANMRTLLIGPHLEHRAPITFARYSNSELQHSYDDLTAAIALQGNYGQAFAARWMIDNRRHDEEQANFDHLQAQKYDPQSLALAETMQQRNDTQVAANMHELERRREAASQIMLGLGVATGALEVVPVYVPDR